MKFSGAILRTWTPLGVAAFLFFSCSIGRSEALLQLFNVSWVEITHKMPELAEAGYTALWLPPPTKGSGGLSVGYDLWDPFDFGSKDQRNSVRTRYGTEAELLEMVTTAHRFGIRVYFDNIMNHRAFDIPGFDENTPFDIYPGMLPEDFHLRKTENFFYRKWDNCRDWNSEWQVQNLGLADLIDIAHETPNTNHGPNEGDDQTKVSFIRDFDRPEQYDTDKDGQRAYFGVLIDQARADLVAGGTPSPTSVELKTKAQDYINARKSSFTEDVGAYLIRAARYKIDRTKADGLRLDAVKHVPDYFFGQQSGANKDSSDAGYLGGVQWQFNRTRGFSDWDNHRNSVFEDKAPRDDAMVFGEHLGQPPGYGGYWDAGMRLVDNDLRSKLNGTLGNAGATLSGLDAPGAGGFAASLGVTHANSHDSEYAALKEWQHAYYMTREGMGLIYSDGYNKAETLGASGGAFPRHANTAFLGQFGDPRIPNILKLHNDFARGLQQGRWADGDYLAFERRDNRNPDGSTRIGSSNNEITMIMMMNDNKAQGQSRNLTTSFPSGAYLYQYAEGPNGSFMGGFYKYAGELNTVVVPPEGYFLFSYRTPELSTLWPDSAITFYQTNATTGQVEEVPRITVTRKDGREGDPAFNPSGLANRGYAAGTTPVPYTYQTTVPVVKAGQPFTILARADGSAENILLKLDGGVDLNGTGLGADPAKRDNPPGLRTDIWLGYEQPSFVDRQHPEKFAAVIATNCQTGSPGAETYVKTVGGGMTINPGPVGVNSSYGTDGGNVVSFVYHDPEATVGGPSGTAGVGDKQLAETGSDFVIWIKTNSGLLSGFRAVVYYTIDGSFPEGAGGIGRGSTQVAALNWRHDQGAPDAGSWWGSANIPKPTPGAKLTYKIGVYRTEKTAPLIGAPVETPSWWPGDANSVAYKKKMLTTFRVADFNPATVQHFPHNDYARTPTLGVTYSNWPWAMQTGLSEGFHVIRARAFLPTGKGGRSADAAPLYQTFTQTFYYDAQTPEGVLAFPANNGDTVGGSGYEMVVRTDMTVQEVWYSITDSDTDNDDAVTKAQNGNGAGFEPFVDANGNGAWNSGETFTDLNGNGTYDTELPGGELYVDSNGNGRRDGAETFTDANGNGVYDAPRNWAKATEVTPSLAISNPYQKEWRFTYDNIPLSGAGIITIRFLEASSSRNMTLSAAAANVTELTRTVETRGSAERILIGYPSKDGDVVDDNYIMKVWFPKTLSNTGITESNMISRFTFLADGTAQDRTGWYIGMEGYGSFGPANAFHQLHIPLPNLYTSTASQRELRVVYRDPGNTNTTYTAIRRVIVNPSSKPFIRITRPTLVGSDGRPTEIILPDGPGPDSTNYTVQVETSTNVATPPTLSISGTIANNTPSFEINGSIKTWSYPWAITNAGTYNLEAEAILGGSTPTKVARAATVILRQVVGSSGFDDRDDDNDGLLNIHETNKQPLPADKLPENYSNGDVHLHRLSGLSLPTSPDSDGDGLPDGLEVGWRSAANPPTDTTADSNGDGKTNFRGDLDPPLYAVTENYPAVPGVQSRSIGDDRTRQAHGSVTDPADADSDDDGLPDGVEDANINGWTDGDGQPLPPAAGISDYSTNRPNDGDWPNDTINTAWEIWKETSPTEPDSDGDKLKDGFEEDTNSNGQTDLYLLSLDGTSTITKPLKLDVDVDTPLVAAGADYRSGGLQSRGILYSTLRADYSPAGNGEKQVDGYPKLLIKETDPLNADTDGDGLPDGWEKQNRLDPLDDGTYNYFTGGPGNPQNGANGNPDGDDENNLAEYFVGSDPRFDDRTPPVSGDGAIQIGTFRDWRPDDLLALDEYDNGGNVSDVYRNSYSSTDGGSYNDGYNSSRDLVAFSFRDGGDPAASGDGKLYFRADFVDLQPNAWQGNVDLYVAINIGNPGNGEKSLPDEVEMKTTMGWQAVVGVYGTNGTVYVDTNLAVNTDNWYQNPAIGGYGVVSRGVATDGLVASAWSSTLDACEFSINRQTLKDLGWDGDPAELHFQVYTTRDGTGNSPAGFGDLKFKKDPNTTEERNDLRDTIGDDWVCSDYYNDQPNIVLNAQLSSWFGRGDAWNDRGKAAKVLLLGHANEALQPASFIHNRIKNGTTNNAPGYSRWLKVHEDNQAPVSLHLTATLAAALQWANSTDPTRDGPSFNSRVKAGMNQGWLDLLGTTFADHVLKYFPLELNRANVLAAQGILDGIYGTNSAVSSRQVFWPCERVLDNASLEQIRQMGFTHTFADQNRHLLKWFGRTSALGNSGYRINEVNGIKIIPIHDVASEDLAENHDGGTAMDLRLLLSRRSRSGLEDQVVTLWRDLGDLTNEGAITAYENNVKWLVNRPWVRLVTATKIATGQVPYKGQNGGSYNQWGGPSHGTNKTLALSGKDLIDHATQNNYDNWYDGSVYEEGLRNRRFAIRSGVTNTNVFGKVGTGNTIMDSTWNSLAGITNSPHLSPLAHAALGSSLFQTAFHNVTSTNLSKFSSGEYISPDTGTGQTLADFAKFSQAQTREAAIYGRVQQWATQALSTTLGTATEDIDLDNENEYLLFNSRIFAVFEASGGRMTAAWMRNPSNGKIWQVIGNLASYGNTETEDEGASNVSGSNNVINAYRTSGFKDWWVVSSTGSGNNNRVNSLYNVTAATDGTGWVLNSQDGVTKTIRLANASSDRLVATYTFGSRGQAYIRFGLSPHLQDLMIRGQSALSVTTATNNQRMDVANVSTNETVRAYLQVAGDVVTGSTASINTAAIDTATTSAFTATNMRNQAQTQQVEVALDGEGPHVITLGFDNGVDATDGILDSWWTEYGITGADRTASGDFDGDGVSNLLEYRLNSNPTNSLNTGLPALDTTGANGLSTDGFRFSFQTRTNVSYQPAALTDLTSTNWNNVGLPIPGTGNVETAIDPSATNSVRKFYKLKITPSP